MIKNYQNFIAFIVILTGLILWLNNLVSCPASILGFQIPCPIFSWGIISLIIFIFFLVWNHILWKIKGFFLPNLCGLAGFHSYPNLSGIWKIEYASSYKYDEKKDEYTTLGKGEAEIKQTYSNLFIKGVFGQSSDFESFISCLKQKENGYWLLVYGYTNIPVDPKLQSSPGGGTHRGFCYLELNKRGDKLTGFYSNDEIRKTRGKIVLTKIREK